MKLVKPDVVTIEFSRSEARRLKESLLHEVTWDKTTEADLYEELHDLLREGTLDDVDDD